MIVHFIFPQEEPQDVSSLLSLPHLLDILRDCFSTAESDAPTPMLHGATPADLAALRQRIVDILGKMLSWQAGGEGVPEGMQTNEEEMQVCEMIAAL